MRLTNDMEIRKSDTSPHKFGGDPMAEYLWHLSLEGGADDEIGGMDFGHFVSLFSKRLLFSDEFGFVWVEKLASDTEARERFEAIDREHSQWQVGIRWDRDNDEVTILDSGAVVSLEAGDRGHVTQWKDQDDWQRQAYPWTIVITQMSGTETLVPYWVGPLASEPNAMQALACLVSDGELGDWSTDPAELDDRYFDETGERLSVRKAIYWAEQNRKLAPILSDLDSWNLEDWSDQR